MGGNLFGVRLGEAYGQDHLRGSKCLDCHDGERDLVCSCSWRLGGRANRGEYGVDEWRRVHGPLTLAGEVRVAYKGCDVLHGRGDTRLRLMRELRRERPVRRLGCHLSLTGACSGTSLSRDWLDASRCIGRLYVCEILVWVAV